MRRGQYSLIVFVIATVILLSLSGIVIGFVTEKAEQIAKAQVLFKVGDAVREARSIQREERQVGIDFTGIHLGALGGWAGGESFCGSSRNDSSSWPFKSIPYWHSDPGAANYYNYTGKIYAQGNDYVLFKVNNVAAGRYEFSNTNNINYFLLDGRLDYGSTFDLEAGTHTFLFSTDLCKYTLDCEGGISSGNIPSSLIIHRIIPKGSKYENCIPKEEFIKGIYDLFLNTYFRYMSKLAYDYINTITNTDGFTNRYFLTPLEYRADVRGIGNNTIFAVFYPLNIPLWNIKYKGISNVSYQASTILYDAFRSNFASFQHAAKEVITKKEIENLINEIVTRHSSFNVRTSIHVKGSYNRAYEDFMNSHYNAGWKVTYPDKVNSELSFENYFSSHEIKPYCLYYLKEACQFLSDEVPKGYKNNTYDFNYDLYKDFTKSRLPGGWDKAVKSCQKCHDVGEHNNPCLNLSDSNCLQCFKDLTGIDYDAVNSATYEEGVFYPVSNDYCMNAINSQIKPLLNSYLIYRLKDVESELSEKYGYSWKLDASRLNITAIKFDGLDEGGSSFNSTCRECRTSRVDEDSGCEILTSDLKIENANLTAASKGAYDCYKAGGCDTFSIVPGSCDDVTKTCTIITKDGFLEMDDSEEPLTLNFTVVNKGNTNESINVTVLGDAFNNLQGVSGSAYIYYHLNGLYDKLPTELLLTGNYENDRKFKDSDGHFDFRESYPLDTIVKGETKSYSLNIFSPSDKGLNAKSHLLRICVHTAYNDEWNWTNNCIDLRIGVCSDGDVSKSCCEDISVGGVWLDSPYYGACCGDDRLPYICNERAVEVSFDNDIVENNHAFEDEVMHNQRWFSSNIVSQADGKYGKAMVFDGHTSLSSPLLPSTSFSSVSVVFMWEGGSYLIDHGGLMSHSYLPLIEIGIFNGYLRYRLYPENTWKGGNSFPVQQGKWYKVTVVIDGSKGYLYNWDKLVSEDQNKWGSHSWPTYLFSNEILTVGAKRDGQYYFKGKIDDVVIYRKPLSKKEVIAISKQAPEVCFHQPDFSHANYDDFMANNGAICYHGMPYYCPQGAPIAARVRPQAQIHNYEYGLNNYIDYFCKGGR